MSKLPRPEIGDPQTQSYLQRLNTALESEFAKTSPDSSPRHELLLTAPDKSIWSVTISNAGALVTTKVSNG